MDLAPSNLNPFETNRLLQELANHYASAHQWNDEARRIRDTSVQLITGEASGTLWLKQPDAAGGIAVWDQVPGAGLRVWDLHLGSEDRNLDTYYQFLHGLGKMEDHPDGLFAVSDAVMGFRLEDQKSLLGPMGFVHVPRRLLRAPTRPSAPDAAPRGKRIPIGVDELERVVELQSRAPPSFGTRVFADNPLDGTQSARQRLTDLLLDVDGTGPGPRHTPWGCIGIEENGRIVASLLSHEDVSAPKEKGWIQDLAVDPELQGAGLDEFLLTSYLAEAQGKGLKEASADVVEGDWMASTLHRAGFQSVPGPSGERKGLWVHEARAKKIGIV